MRNAFHDELDGIGLTLLQMAGLVKVAMNDATSALLTVELNSAEKVIAADDVIDEIQHELDARTINLMARQQPVASDLRTLVTSLRMSADLERMGDLAHHIAKVARLRHPSNAIPADLVLVFTEMGHVAEKLSTKVATVITTRDTDMALQVEKDDDEMDELHKKVIIGITNGGNGITIESAIDLTLLGRYYERFADHAVAVARRVYFLVKGEFPQQ